MKIGDILHPFSAWKNLFRDPVTVKKPLERVGAARYRGFHKNDLSVCIGCGSCEAICQNAAIDLVPVSGYDPKDGDSGLRPRIDYGRCCWCALCVDICATNSLSMSNEFVWIERDPEAYRFVPGMAEKPWDTRELGWKRPENYSLNVLERVPMGELAAEERRSGFMEIVKGYSRDEAKREADRCVECGLCVASCPAHMDIPDYIKTIREDDLEAGLRLLYRTNPLPEVCGRICTHRCESACALQHRGDPISIRWLKRYIADQIPRNEYKGILDLSVESATGRKVAIIGAGPAGLGAAYYLSLMGHEAVIFEALEQPGGMMRYGIPEYRLPYDQLDKDIDFIRELGVEIRCSVRVGRDISLEELKEGFDAVYAATGLHQGRSTRVSGSEHTHVYQAIDLLRDFTSGKEIPVMEDIVVIGGGNVAMDISRTLARLQMKRFGRVSLITTSLETEDIMPADREEIVESREEGIVIEPGWGPREIVIENGQIRGLSVQRCLSVFNAEGRFAPSFDAQQQRLFPASMVVESIGQGMDLGYISGSVKEALKLDERGRIKVDSYFCSSLPWLWLGGDIIQGPDVIHAVANGHRAAKGIDRYLRGEK